jgi:hypothetical protein
MRFGASAAAVLLFGLAARISLAAQAGPTLEPVVSFDVASVKQVSNSDRSPMQWQPGGRFTSGVPLLSRDVAIEERPACYRGLLPDRFTMSVRVEPREMDVYALVLARGDGRLGPRLRPSQINCDEIVAERRNALSQATGWQGSNRA